MPPYRFERECRTPNSETYTIIDDESTAGRIDLHYGSVVVHATLCVLENVTQEGIQELIDTIDEELVMTADAQRGDFIVAVYQGREVGIYSDEDFGDEEAGNDQ